MGFSTLSRLNLGFYVIEGNPFHRVMVPFVFSSFFAELIEDLSKREVFGQKDLFIEFRHSLRRSHRTRCLAELGLISV